MGYFSTLACIVVLLEIGECIDRLPFIYDKIAYDISLNISEKALSGDAAYNGTVRLKFKLKENTTKIHLHAKHDYIEIKTVSIQNIVIDRLDMDKSKDILTIHISENISNFVAIEIYFQSRISFEDMYGFFGITHKGNGSTHYMAFSKMEPFYARRMFPCFDEPNFLAKYQLTVQVPEKMVVLFNSGGSFQKGQGVYSFDRTSRLSTSQLSIAIVDFDFLKLLPLSWNLYAENLKNNTHFANQTLTELWSYYNKLFNNNNMKLDVVAVPDIRLSSDGKWGLIIGNTQELLFEKTQTPEWKRSKIMKTFSYTLASQWFAHIHMKWWSVEYFKLGLTKFLEYYVISKVYPDYEFEKHFFIEQVQKLMVTDGLEKTVTLDTPCESESEIAEKFSDSFISKAASIFSMVHHVMGLQNFETGIGMLLKNESLSTTSAEDIWSILDKANNGSFLPGNLSEILNNWLKEPGYPIVTVEEDGNKIIISQGSFSNRNSKLNWYIPITYTTSRDSRKFGATKPISWLKPVDGKVTLLISEDEKEWIILTSPRKGYYRVNYDDTLWNKIIEALRKDDFDNINDLSRAQIVDDAFNLARAGRIKYSKLFDIIEFLKHETSYYTWYVALEGFDFLLERFGEESHLGNNIKNKISTLMNKEFQSVRKSARNSSVDLLKYNLIMKWACRINNPICLEEFAEAFKRYRQKDIRPDKNSEYLVFCNAMRTADIDDWNFLFHNLDDGTLKSFENTSQIFTALGCSRQRPILERYLEMTISSDYQIDQQYLGIIFESVYKSSSEGVKVALDFLQKYSDEMLITYEYLDTVENLLTNLASKLNSQAEIDQMKTIINKTIFPKELKITVGKSLEIAESKVRWAEIYKDQLDEYYNQNWLLIISISVTVTLLVLSSICFLIYRYRRTLRFGFKSKNAVQQRLSALVPLEMSGLYSNEDGSHENGGVIIDSENTTDVTL